MMVKPNPMVLFFSVVLISAPVSWDGSRVKTDAPGPLELWNTETGRQETRVSSSKFFVYFQGVTKINDLFVIGQPLKHS